MVAIATAPRSPRARAAEKAAARARRARRVRPATVIVVCDDDFLGMGEMYAYVQDVRGVADDLKLVIHDAVQAALSPVFDSFGNPAVDVDWGTLCRQLPRWLWGKVVIKQVIPVTGVK